MAQCPKCGSTLVGWDFFAVLGCACGLRVAGTVEHGHLIPAHDNVPILTLTGGAVHDLRDSAG